VTNLVTIVSARNMLTAIEMVYADEVVEKRTLGIE